MNNNDIKLNEVKGYDIFHDLIINAPIEKVFSAITEPEYLVNWWPKKCTGTPRQGAEYNFFFTPEFNWYGIVTEIISNRSFHIKMTKSDKDWNNTCFGFDLEDNITMVQVNFWHTGWPECNAHFRRSSYCWAILLYNLTRYIEKGVVVPFEERE